MRIQIITVFLLFPIVASAQAFNVRLSEAAMSLEDQTVIYDPAYVPLAYPGGDVPADRGVCTDVVIRAYRKVGIDLQREVHRDMKENFHLYPKHWRLTAPDPNIDHRRVPNLMVFFKRKGLSLPVDHTTKTHRPGDIICWDLGGGITHIGLVVDRSSPDSGRYMIMHNIGAGQVLADVSIGHRIIGHFRYSGNTDH